jgi:hypothetical protein
MSAGRVLTKLKLNFMANKQSHDKKVICGPCGLHCECCRRVPSIKEGRIMLNRRSRRRNKISDNNFTEI